MYTVYIIMGLLLYVHMFVYGPECINIHIYTVYTFIYIQLPITVLVPC